MVDTVTRPPFTEGWFTVEVDITGKREAPEATLGGSSS
jgi:hypothetical protein